MTEYSVNKVIHEVQQATLFFIWIVFTFVFSFFFLVSLTFSNTFCSNKYSCWMPISYEVQMKGEVQATYTGRFYIINIFSFAINCEQIIRLFVVRYENCINWNKVWKKYKLTVVLKIFSMFSLKHNTRENVVFIDL